MAAVGADDDEEGPPGGERSYNFKDGQFIVKVFEDFLAAAIGGVVTQASVELARYVVEEIPEAIWQEKVCVELGAGCGLVSSALLRLGANVVATEQEPFIAHLEWNLSLNTPSDDKPGSCRCESLDWTDVGSRQRLRQSLGKGSTSGANMLFAANCVYDRSAAAPFLATVSGLMGKAEDAMGAFVCGVPVPPSLAGGGGAQSETILDVFLRDAVKAFDCYLLAPLLDPKTAGRGEAEPGASASTSAAELVDEVGERRVDAPQDSSSLPPPMASAAGFAQTLARKHGVTLGQMADGIWLLMPPNQKPQPWVQIAFQLDVSSPDT